MRLIHLGSLPFLLVLVSPRAGAELPLPSLQRYFAAYDKGAQPGAAVLVLRDGKVLHRRGYGLANLEHHRAITPRTAFDLASLSKQFTALGIAMLAEQGKLSYDDPVGRHLPELPAYARKVTLRQLIHHTSGLPEYLDLKLRSAKGRPRPPRTNREVVAVLEQQKRLTAPPGTRHVYNNTGYVLLAQVIEKASGLSYGEFMRRRVFDPLGMTQSFVEGEVAPGPVALGYRRVPTLRSFGLAREPTAGSIVGDGGIHSSLDDMQRWARALERGTLVRPATLRQVFSKGSTRAGKPVNYGFGWWFERHAGRDVAVHTGSWRGFKNVMAYVPREKLWVIILGNSGGATPRRLLRPWLRSYLPPPR